MKAVILGAGQGRRLAGFHDRPKGFLEVGGSLLIERSMAALRSSGVREVAIVTGHQSERYVEWAEREPGVVTVFNRRFREAGSLCSLLAAGAWVDSPFLLLESDILFEPRALGALLAAPEEDVVLLSGLTHAGDEVFVEVSEGRLTGVSKDPTCLTGVAGEWVGLCKLSLAGFRRLSARFLLDSQDMPGLEYEHGLVELSRERPVACLTVEDLLWCEIDDPGQYRRACEVVGPAIRAREGERGSSGVLV